MNELGVKKHSCNCLLTKPPASDHSCCSLVRTNANSSGVHAMQSSPYKVKDDKVLPCQGRIVAVVGSSVGREPVIPSPQTGGPSDMLARSLNWDSEQGGFMAWLCENKKWLYLPHCLGYDLSTPSLLE